MDEIEKFKEQLHEDTIETELERLRIRRETDPTFTIKQLKNILDHECKHQDVNWSDRGGIQHIEGQARVAALEIAYHDWMKELSGAGS